MEGISEIVGDAVFPNRSVGMAYRALRALECARCGAVIAAGTLFTRRSTQPQNLHVWPQCRRCAPFELQPSGQENQASSQEKIDSEIKNVARNESATENSKSATETLTDAPSESATQKKPRSMLLASLLSAAPEDKPDAAHRTTRDTVAAPSPSTPTPPPTAMPPTTPTPALPPPTAPAQARSRKIAEDIERRLGPALRRSRRPRT